MSGPVDWTQELWSDLGSKARGGAVPEWGVRGVKLE